MLGYDQLSKMMIRSNKLTTPSPFRSAGHDPLHSPQALRTATKSDRLTTPSPFKSLSVGVVDAVNVGIVVGAKVVIIVVKTMVVTIVVGMVVVVGSRDVRIVVGAGAVVPCPSETVDGAGVV
jgi:hypothetical protein